MSFSFKTWPFPSPKKNTHLLKCSKYGLVAHAMNNNVSIYVEEFGHFTPLLMWSPFQHQITALEWYDASKTMNTTVPVFVLSSLSGRLEVYDCRSRIAIFRSNINLNEHSANDPISAIQYPTPTTISQSAANSRRENDYVTSITWSQFSSSCFFVGTKNGRLLRFEITIGQIVKCRVVWELFFDFQIDYICIEPQFGEVCAIASEKGSIATIQNINKYQEGKPPEASPNVVTLLNKTDSIHEIKFYPTSTQFLILVTTSNSLLYSISDCCTAPLLMLPGIRKLHILHDSGNIALTVRDDSVELWKFLTNQNKRLSEAKLITSPKYANVSEILVSDMMGDNLVFITSQMWLTMIEVKFSSKLFVTRRAKLLDSKPLSFSYANESIAIATANGNVLVSETSNPNFIAQMNIKTHAPQKPPELETVSVEPTNSSNAKPSSPKLLSPDSKKRQQQQPQNETPTSTNSSSIPSFNNSDQGFSASPLVQNPEDNSANAEKVPSFSPSPLLGGTYDVNQGSSTNSRLVNLNLNLNLNLNIKTNLNNDSKGKLSESKSQDIRQLIEGPISETNPKSSRSPTRRSRVRRSIIKSCASSSSLFLDSIGGESSKQDEEILDKSIVIDNQKQKQQQQQHSPPPSPTKSLPGINRNSPTRISGNANRISFNNIAPATVTNRKRRFSSNPSEGLNNASSVLSRVSNEGIKTMPKDSSLVPVIPPSASKIQQSKQQQQYGSPSELVSYSPPKGSSDNNSNISSESIPKFSTFSVPTNQQQQGVSKFGAIPPIPTNQQGSSIPKLSSAHLPSTGEESHANQHPLSPSLTSSIPSLQPMANVSLQKTSSGKTFKPPINPEEAKKSYQQVSTKVIPKSKFGNNCTLMWNYELAKNTKIENIEWIASTRVMAYTLAKPVQDREDEKPLKKGSKDKLTSDSSESLDSSNRLETTQKFSGLSFIYLIDLKHHRLTRLFDKPGINITSVTFSANKQYFFVTINGFMAVLFKNKIKPQQIHSFTFNKSIYVTFIPYYLVIVDVNGECTFTTLPDKEEETKITKRQVRMKKEYGSITCIYGKKYCIYLGTSSGTILSFDVNSSQTNEVLQMKSSVLQFKPGPSGSFLIEDIKGNMLTISPDSETMPLPVNLKAAILTSPTTLLIRRKKTHYIEVYQTIGQYNPSYPKAAVRCPMMMPTNRWIQSLVNEDQIDQNVLINYGMSNIASLLDARKSPNFTYEQISFLRDLIMDTPQLWKKAYRLSLFLRDFEAAHTIIAVNTIPSNTDKDWALNMMKCALFMDDVSLKDSQVESILFSATSLIKNGFINDGVDILLTAGLWVDAVKILYNLDRMQDAAVITRVYRDENSLNVVNEMATKLFQTPNMIPYALTMLCEVGLDNAAIAELESLGQNHSAYILKMVNDNESLNL